MNDDWIMGALAAQDTPPAPPEWAMGALAAQDQYRPLGNDPWTGLMQGQQDLPLGGAPEPPSPVVFKTASPLVNITQRDLDNATELALSFSGGGLSTKSAAPGGILAYHGSPHDFERFDLSKIGTGEGAQAYGHGLYFAENPGVAQSYKAAGQPSYLGADRITAAQDLLKEAGGDRTAALNLAQARMSGTTKYSEGKLWTDVINNFDDLVGKGPGKMYEVNINADPAQMLDWDKPVAQQSEHVRAVYQNLKGGIDPQEAAAKVRSLQDKMTELASDRDPVTNQMRNEQQWHRLARERDATWEDWNAAQSGAKFYGSMHRKAPIATDVIREAGIPGIKYLDAGSRGAGQGSSNYVVFNPDIIDILRKYGIAGAAPVGMGALAAQDQYNTP